MRVSFNFRASESFDVYGTSAMFLNGRGATLTGEDVLRLQPKDNIVIDHNDLRFLRPDRKYRMNVLWGRFTEYKKGGGFLLLRVQIFESNDPDCQPPIRGTVELRDSSKEGTPDLVTLALPCLGGDASGEHTHGWSGRYANVIITHGGTGRGG